MTIERDFAYPASTKCKAMYIGRSSAVVLSRKQGHDTRHMDGHPASKPNHSIQHSHMYVHTSPNISIGIGHRARRRSDDLIDLVCLPSSTFTPHRPQRRGQHGRQTSYQGACGKAIIIHLQSLTLEKSAGNTPLLRIRGGGRGWLCYFLIKRKEEKKKKSNSFGGVYQVEMTKLVTCKLTY